MQAVSSSAELFGAKRWELPPLILHPFSDKAGPSKLLDSSRASLMLSGMLPRDEFSEDELEVRLIEGRLCEMRMLYFVGKDLMRWIEQCAEFAKGHAELSAASLKEECFADLLVHNTPITVQQKLRAWGVVDYRAIFSRALGLHAIFCEPPQLDSLNCEFVRNYYRYADHLFACRQQLAPFTEITPENFHFEIYASGEYSRILADAWK